MAVQSGWISPLGTNSKRVSYPAAATLADLMDTIESVITGMGWTLYDASAGTNARAYRAANLPDRLSAGSYKYIVLDYNQTGYLMLKVYESWNASTHVGTNLASGSDDYANASQRVDLTLGGAMSIFATARYLVLNSVVSAGIGCVNGLAFTGVFETERANYDDTVAAGYPPYFWAYGSGLANNNAGGYVVSFCRTRGGATAAAARQYSFVAATATRWGAYPISGTIGDFSAMVLNYVNIWSAKDYVSSLIVGMGGASNQEIRGRAYGLHIMGRFGSGTVSPGDYDAVVKVDANGWFDPSGTNTEFWILGTSQYAGRFLVPK